MEEVLRDILSELQLLNVKIDKIVDKLPITASVYNIDDIYNKIGEAANDITGSMGYNLGDIHSQLAALESAIDLK